MPDKNEQLRIQDILFYTHSKTIDRGTEREKINDTNNNIYRISLHKLLH